jgi:hypothetical protein
VNFFMHTGSETQKISRSHPQEYEFTAVGTEPHPIRIEIHLNPPFDAQPMIVDFELQLEPPGTTFQHSVLLDLSKT